MVEEADHIRRLDRANKPIAIVHEGFFVYANQAFLDTLGYQSLESLQEAPLLDLVEEGHQESLRQHLARGKSTAGTERYLPETKLTFVRSDGLPLGISTTAFRTRYGGEECVQLTLERSQQLSLAERVQILPWKLYISIAFLVLFTVLPLSLLPRLNINNAPEVYFPDDEPAVVIDRKIRELFPSDQVIVLLFEGVALYSDGFLKAYDDLARFALEHPKIEEVIGVTTQDHIAGTAEEFIVEPLIDVGRLDETSPSQRLRRATGDRFSGGTLVATDGSAIAMVLVPREVHNSVQRLALETDMRSGVDRFQLGGYLKSAAGQIQLDIAELRSMLRDNMIFIPATVTMGLLLVWWLFRRMLAVILSGIAIGVVINSTVAIFVLIEQPFTLISSIIPPLLSALTVAAMVHLFNAIHHASVRGLVGQERVARALLDVERPARFTMLTTAAGLASLATSPIVPIKMFGMIAAVGVVIIYLVVFAALPHLLRRWDAHRWPTARSGMSLMDSLVGHLYRVGVRRPGAVVLISLLLLGISLPFLLQIKVETNIQEFFSPSHGIRQATARVEEKLSGTGSLDVLFEVEERDGLKDPAKLGFIRGFQVWAEGQPEIDNSISPADFVEEMHWAFNAEQSDYRRIPEDERLIRQYLLIYDGDDIYDFVDREFRHARVNLNLRVHGANEIESVMDRVREYLNTHAGGNMRWEIAGYGRLFADMEELLVRGQVYSLLGALGLIFFLMLFLWRSVPDAVLCMVPNLSPVLLIFIVMGAMGVWLDMGTAMVASVAVGIAVDDTIHVYHGFRQRVSRGISPVLAIARAYRHAGRAVVTTTVILSAQFLILMASQFQPTKNFGLLTTVGLIAALLFDLVLMPALLILFFGPKRPFAKLFGRRRRFSEPQGPEVTDESAAVDVYWSAERKAALVKEIFRGRVLEKAARDYGLAKDEIRRWVATAEQGVVDALDGHSVEKLESYERKLKTLAKAYKRTKTENQDLKQQAKINRQEPIEGQPPASSTDRSAG